MIVEVYPQDDPARTERRRHQRAKVRLRGRYMLADRREYACQAIEISAGGIAILGAIKGEIGERVVAYFDRIGRVEGMIVRHFDKCFVIELSASALKRERLDLRIGWLVRREAGLVADSRRHERIALYRWRTNLKTADGQDCVAHVVDLSVSGAAISVNAAPPIGSNVTLGDRTGVVVRHFHGGIAVTFTHFLGEKDLETHRADPPKSPSQEMTENQ
jgi:PilZ domain